MRFGSTGDALGVIFLHRERARWQSRSRKRKCEGQNRPRRAGRHVCVCVICSFHVIRNCSCSCEFTHVLKIATSLQMFADIAYYRSRSATANTKVRISPKVLVLLFRRACLKRPNIAKKKKQKSKQETARNPKKHAQTPEPHRK